MPSDLDYSDFIYEPNMYDSYNKYRVIADTDIAVKGIPYVFFSTPMLSLKENSLTANSFLTYMYSFYPELLDMLCYGNSSEYSDCNTTSPIIKLLTNTIQGFDTNDQTLGTMDYGESWFGTKVIMPTTSINSDIIGGTISCRFNDFSNYPVLNLINAWFQYISDVSLGRITTYANNIYNKKLDFTSSVYYFLTDLDGETLRYWTKYTGVFPTNVPFSSLGGQHNNARELVEYNISFAYSVKEDMDFNILTDFNKLVNGFTAIKYEDVDSTGSDSEANGGYLPLLTQTAYQYPANYKIDHDDFEESIKSNVEIILTKRDPNNELFVDDQIRPKLRFYDED